MEGERLDPNAAGPGLHELVLDGIQVAVVHVDRAAVDPQPCPAVEDPAAPVAEFGHLAGIAEIAQRGRIEGAAVVDPEIPIAVVASRAPRPRSAEGHRLDLRKGRELRWSTRRGTPRPSSAHCTHPVPIPTMLRQTTPDGHGPETGATSSVERPR